MSVCLRERVCASGITSLSRSKVKNSAVRAEADLLGAVQSKDITVGLSMWERDDLLTL